MKRALVAGLVVLGVAAGCGGSRHATSLPGLTAKKLAKLEAIVQNDARIDGDAHPLSVMVYASRRHEANVVAGAGTGVLGSQPVYLVVVRGQFVCSTCSGPAGAAPPKGNVITLVLGRSKLQGLDFGIGGQQIDTGALGPGLPVSLG
jgi:hypothetical protein